MSIYITIDGGTTNTRLSLIKDGAYLGSVKSNVGARRSIDGKDLLKKEIASGIRQLLQNHALQEKDVSCIIASGMITSEFGLCQLEHLQTPAGLAELHAGMQRMELAEITSIPFFFIRGIKVCAENFEKFDVMRGEETELMGIWEEAYGDCIYVLPGSHSKVIKVDQEGRVVDFFTMLTGEMIGALSSQTILKDAVDLSASEICEKYLLSGYDYAVREGINKALFKVRILKNFFGCDRNAVYSFFLGAVLSAEIGSIIGDGAQSVVIGGRKQIRQAMAILLNHRSDKRVVLLDDLSVERSTALGAIRIYQNDSQCVIH